MVFTVAGQELVKNRSQKTTVLEQEAVNTFNNSTTHRLEGLTLR